MVIWEQEERRSARKLYTANFHGSQIIWIDLFEPATDFLRLKSVGKWFQSIANSEIVAKAVELISLCLFDRKNPHKRPLNSTALTYSMVFIPRSILA